MEIEEGEAIPYPDNDEKIDPVEAFSHIDERIEDVLGQYRKDFEGDVSRQSLGARFGMYGSFLPAYKRSVSVLSEPKNPQEGGSHKASCAQQRYLCEDTRPDSVVLPRGTLQGRKGPDLESVPPATLSTDVNSSFQIQSDGKNVSNQNFLKVRIKMGSKDILPHKRGEIYSGLGLDMSPYSSEKNSPALCRDNLVKPQQILDQSPSSIIKQMMTSFLPPGGLLLSPLEDCLVHFSEEKFFGNRKCSPIQEVSVQKNVKVDEQVGNFPERMNAKETISSEMKPKSNLKCEVENAAEGTCKNPKAKIRIVRSRIEASYGGKETPSSLSSDEQFRQTCASNAEAGFAENHSYRIDGLDARRDGVMAMSSHEPPEETRKRENGFAGGKSQPDNEKFDQRASANLQSLAITTKKKKEPCFEGKNKLKGSSSFPAVSAEGNSMKSRKVIKESRKDDCDSVGKVKSVDKRASANRQSLAITTQKKEDPSFEGKNKLEGSSSFPAIRAEGNSSKSQKDIMQSRKDGCDSFRKVNSGDRENKRDSTEVISKNREKSAKNAFGYKIEDRPVGKKTVSVSKPDSTPGDLSKVASQNGTSSEILTEETAPVVIQDKWVGCDRCGKWRLLPYETDLSLLPKKWNCRMLNWLPGMNKCHFSEEETKNALMALYFVPVPGIQLKQHNSSDGVTSDITLSGTKLDKSSQEVVSSAVSSVGEENHGGNEASDAGGTARPLKIRCKRKAEPVGGKAEPVGGRVLKKPKNESPHNDLAKNHVGSIKQAKYQGINQEEHSFPQSSQNAVKNTRQNDPVLTVVAQEEHSTRDISRKKRKLNDIQNPQSHLGISQSKLKGTRSDNQKDENFSPKYLPEVSSDVSLDPTCKQKRVVKNTGALDKYSNKDISIKKRKLRVFEEDLEDTETEIETCLGKDTESALKNSKGTSTQDRINKASSTVLSIKRQSEVDSDAFCKEDCTKNGRPQGQHLQGKLSELPSDDRSCRRNELGSKKSFVATTSGSSKVPTIRKVKSDKIELSPVNPVSLSPSRTPNAQKPCKSLLGLKAVSAKSQRGFGVDKHEVEVSQSERKDKLTHRRPLKSSKSDFPIHVDANSRLSDKERKQNHNVEHNGSPKKPERRLFSSGSENNLIIASDTSIRRRKGSYDMKSESQDCPHRHNEDMEMGKLLTLGNQSKLEKVERIETKPTKEKSVLKSAFLELPVSLAVNTPESGGFHVSTLFMKQPFDSSANSILKEANDLKDSANGLKISGSEIESAELFFQAALKFLHGASLIETCKSGSDSCGDMAATEVYGTTAKLCEYCAHEYERYENMAFAALAYKCMEVSYMRMIYSADFLKRGVFHKLQTALEMVPAAESPSTPASAVDNMEYQSVADVKDIAKNLDTPQSTGNYIVNTSTQSHCAELLLKFTYNVDLAMEASRKSRDAFAAASEILDEAGNPDGISSIKSVIDFSFHEVEDLLNLVRHAMKILSG